ncbi:MAG: hypothetical protein MI757_19600 [Pirellulales bacterium]|nr:hypothetical protein [Pirellulales bacterium]
MKQGAFDDALKTLEKVRPSGGVRLMAVLEFLRAGEVERAEKIAVGGLQEGFHAQAWAEVALGYATKGDLERATACMKKAATFIDKMPRSQYYFKSSASGALAAAAVAIDEKKVAYKIATANYELLPAVCAANIHWRIGEQLAKQDDDDAYSHFRMARMQIESMPEKFEEDRRMLYRELAATEGRVGFHEKTLDWISDLDDQSLLRATALVGHAEGLLGEDVW